MDLVRQWPTASLIANSSPTNESPESDAQGRNGQDLHNEALGSAQASSHGPGDQELDVVGKSLLADPLR